MAFTNTAANGPHPAPLLSAVEVLGSAPTHPLSPELAAKTNTAAALTANDRVTVLGRPGTPRYPECFCSQCGASIGPGNAGVSRCVDHATPPCEAVALLPPSSVPVPVPATLRPIDSTSIEDISWLGRDLCVVTWMFLHDSMPRVTLISCEFEPADRSVGQGAGINTDGDCPTDILEHVSEVAMERLIDSYDDCQEYEPDDRDYEPDADDRMEAF